MRTLPTRGRRHAHRGANGHLGPPHKHTATRAAEHGGSGSGGRVDPQPALLGRDVVQNVACRCVNLDGAERPARGSGSGVEPVRPEIQGWGQPRGRAGARLACPLDPVSSPDSADPSPDSAANVLLRKRLQERFRPFPGAVPSRALKAAWIKTRVLVSPVDQPADVFLHLVREAACHCVEVGIARDCPVPDSPAEILSAQSA